MITQSVNRKVQWFVLACSAPAAVADAVLLAISPSATVGLMLAGALLLAISSALLLFVCDRKPSSATES